MAAAYLDGIPSTGGERPILPPLVDPAAALSPDEAARTARQIVLPELGEIGQRRLAAARVLVIGAGGLGAPALLYLAAAGVGTIGIVDDDVVSVPDLHRQVIHAATAVGEPKVVSATRRIGELAPGVRVEPHLLRLDQGNAATVMAGYDLVLDGTDSFGSRYLIADTCAALGIPLVWGSVLRFDAQVSVFWSNPPAGFSGVTLRDVFPTPPPPGSVPSCAEAGVLGALCGLVGSMMAAEAIKLIAGIGEVLLGRLAVIDALTMQVHQIPLRPRAGAAATPTVPARMPSSTGDPLALATAAAFDALSHDSCADVVLVDVREPSEYALDALPAAVSLPISLIEQAARSGQAALQGLLADAGIADDRPLALYCSAGTRAARASHSLAAAGRRVYVLAPDAVTGLRSRGRPDPGSSPG